MKKLFMGFMCLLMGGCIGIPDGVVPVNDFKLNNYLGKWYEIARLDHSFERGLTHVTADYSLLDDGGVQVINKGFKSETNQWKTAVGKAFFVNTENEGFLKVSFFWPFYGSYIIFELDKNNYQYAFVSGPKTSYLWLLSRTPLVKKNVIEKFIHRSEALGFDVDKLIFVDQE